MERENFKKTLDLIQNDFLVVSNRLKECIFLISNSEEFEYPIIIATSEKTTIGELAIAANEIGNTLSYYATYLDFLVFNGIIGHEGLANFKEIYDQNSENCCVLVISDDELDVVYIPYV